MSNRQREGESEVKELGQEDKGTYTDCLDMSESQSSQEMCTVQCRDALY